MRFINAIALIPIFFNYALAADTKLVKGTGGEVVRNIGCITADNFKTTITPPEMWKGTRTCIDNEQFRSAAELALVARAYDVYDKNRVSDPTARNANTYLMSFAIQGVEPTKLEKIEAWRQKFISGPDHLVFCGDLKKLGPPTYYPQYMIAHGMHAIRNALSPAHAKNNVEPPLVQTFDSKGIWDQIVFGFMKCPKP